LGPPVIGVLSLCLLPIVTLVATLTIVKVIANIVYILSYTRLLIVKAGIN